MSVANLTECDMLRLVRYSKFSVCPGLWPSPWIPVIFGQSFQSLHCISPPSIHQTEDRAHARILHSHQISLSLSLFVRSCPLPRSCTHLPVGRCQLISPPAWVWLPHHISRGHYWQQDGRGRSAEAWRPILIKQSADLQLWQGPCHMVRVKWGMRLLKMRVRAGVAGSSGVFWGNA